MIIFCEVCRCNHKFTGLEAERLIYILQAFLSDEVSGQIISQHNEKSVDSHFDCLKQLLSDGMDVECYYEHIESMREARINNGRKGNLQ